LDGLTGWCVARRGVLASAATVVSNTAWSGFRALFGVDIGFLEHASGTGSLVLSCCGMVDMVTLDSGELITVEPGHLLAYTDHTQARLRAASQSLPQSVRTGEGLVLDFAGPGQLLTQTRSPRSFAEWLSAIGDAR